MGRVAGRFARVDLRRRARAFVRGLLADLPRKNCWTIAEHVGDASPDGMQHLLGRAVWDEHAVRDDLRTYLVEHLGDPEALLVIDETGDLKHGTATVGVQRQYTGTAGRSKRPGRGLPGLRRRCRARADRPGAVPAPVVDQPPRAPAGGRRPRPGRVCDQAGAGQPDAGPRAGRRGPGSVGDRRRGLRRQPPAPGRVGSTRGRLRAGSGLRPPCAGGRGQPPRRRPAGVCPGSGVAADLVRQGCQGAPLLRLGVRPPGRRRA
jgi:hypothetical protein